MHDDYKIERRERRMADAREQFERWYVGALVTQGAREIERNAQGDYILMQTRLAWQAWHAGWVERGTDGVTASQECPRCGGREWIWDIAEGRQTSKVPCPSCGVRACQTDSRLVDCGECRTEGCPAGKCRNACIHHMDAGGDFHEFMQERARAFEQAQQAASGVGGPDHA